MFFPFGIDTPRLNRRNGSSSRSFPSSTNCKSTLITNVFVLLPAREHARHRARDLFRPLLQWLTAANAAPHAAVLLHMSP
jgi:hypothetical protein